MTDNIGLSQQNNNSVSSYDWVDVVQAETARRQQQQEYQRQQANLRRIKYKEILQEEISQKEQKKLMMEELKRQERIDLQDNMKRMDETNLQKALVQQRQERDNYKSNMSIKQRQENIKTQARNDNLDDRRLVYSNSMPGQQQQQQPFMKEGDMGSPINQQLKESSMQKQLLQINHTQAELAHMDQTQLELALKADDARTIRGGTFDAEKSSTFEKVKSAYKEKERRQQEFEHSLVRDGLREQLQREQQRQNLYLQNKRSLQSQVDQLVSSQLDYKDQERRQQLMDKQEDKNKADQEYLQYRLAEKQRQLDNKQQLMRQSIINLQQSELKNHIKERQKHMNDNEMKINTNKVILESPDKGIISKSNLIYLDDYVSYDRERQLQCVDKDLQAKAGDFNRFKDPTGIRSSSMNNLSLSAQQDQGYSSRFSNNQLKQQQSWSYVPGQKLPPGTLLPVKDINKSNVSSVNYDSKNGMNGNAQQPQTARSFHMQSTSPQQQQSQQPPSVPSIPGNTNNNTRASPKDYNFSTLQNMRRSLQPALSSTNVQLPCREQVPQQVEQNNNNNNSMGNIVGSYQGAAQNRVPFSPNSYYQQFSSNVAQAGPSMTTMNQLTQQQKTSGQLQQQQQIQQQVQPAPQLTPQQQQQPIRQEGKSPERTGMINMPSQPQQQQPYLGNSLASSNGNTNPNNNNTRYQQQQQPLQQQQQQQQYPVSSNDHHQIAVYRVPAYQPDTFSKPLYPNRPANIHSSKNYNNNNSSLRSGADVLSYADNRQAILQAQKQDYQLIRQNNCNWAQRGFNIISGK